jgi:hypothetical protein
MLGNDILSLVKGLDELLGTDMEESIVLRFLMNLLKELLLKELFFTEVFFLNEFLFLLNKLIFY